MDHPSETAIFPGCQSMLSQPTQLWIEVEGWEAADKLLRTHRKFLKDLAGSLGKDECKIWYSNNKKPLTIRVSGTTHTHKLKSMTNSLILPRDASTLRVLDFIREQRANGLCASITTMTTDICLQISDLMTQERGIILPYQYIGMNLRYYWRDSMSEYNRLIELLIRDGFIPNYLYRMRRVDGSLAQYEADYFLVENYLGCPVRISVSKPDAWELVSERTTI